LEDGRLSKSGLEARKTDVISGFIESTAEQLRLKENHQIDLVFSHGDFSLVNILSTKDGIMVIDWESAGHRSTLFDLHNYFLTELHYGRATTNLVSEINEAIYIARTLPSLAETYRRLYYLERVLMLLERELSNSLLDVILRSIAVFNRYEEAITGERSRSQR
jgi:aminoglycoside phosphotransferase (APT) family kinase protein